MLTVLPGPRCLPTEGLKWLQPGMDGRAFPVGRMKARSTPWWLIAVIETISETTTIPVIAVAEARQSGIDLLPAATVLGATRAYRKPISSELLWRELCWLTGGTAGTAVERMACPDISIPVEATAGGG